VVGRAREGEELREGNAPAFEVWGLGFWVWGLGFGVWGVAFEVLGFGFWVLGLGFGAWILGCGVWGVWFKFSSGVVSAEEELPEDALALSQ
jgi:hypothetical protein